MSWVASMLSFFDKRISKQASQLQFLYSNDLHNDNIWNNLKFLEAMCCTFFIEILQI
jgi:hypothetical protein